VTLKSIWKEWSDFPYCVIFQPFGRDEIVKEAFEDFEEICKEK